MQLICMAIPWRNRYRSLTRFLLQDEIGSLDIMNMPEDGQIGYILEVDL